MPARMLEMHAAGWHQLHTDLYRLFLLAQLVHLQPGHMRVDSIMPRRTVLERGDFFLLQVRPTPLTQVSGLRALIRQLFTCLCDVHWPLPVAVSVVCLASRQPCRLLRRLRSGHRCLRFEPVGSIWRLCRQQREERL